MSSVNMTPEELVQWGKAKGLLSDRIDLVCWGKKQGLISMLRKPSPVEKPKVKSKLTPKQLEAKREAKKLWARKKYAANKAAGLTVNGTPRIRHGFTSRILTPAQIAARRKMKGNQ